MTEQQDNHMVEETTPESSEGSVDQSVEVEGALDEFPEDIVMTPEEEQNAMNASDNDGQEDAGEAQPDGEPEVEEVDNEEDTDSTPSRLSFADRAEGMGLSLMGDDGCFHYGDTFSEIVYRTLRTGVGANIVDNVEVSPLAIFTKEAGLEGEWGYVGFISNMYKFQGNEDLINQIRESIQSIGNTVLRENSLMSPNLAQLRHEIVIANATNVPSVGDIYPLLNITNSYDGTKAANIGFGLFFSESESESISFGSKTKFGNMRQIHLEGSGTTLSASIGDYVDTFSQNIGDFIQMNFDNHLNEDDMLKSLDLIERQAGKKRRDAISAVLTDEFGGEGIESWTITSWQLFLAITRFSSVEKNINAKQILENVAERVLVLPAQMIEALATINS